MAGVMVCPYGTGRSFTNERLFYAHVRDWPSIAESNGLNLDGSPRVAAEAPVAPLEPAESPTVAPEPTERPVTPTRAKRGTKTRTKR